MSPAMKKLILSLTIAAFAVAVQAGDTCPAKDKACCPKAGEQTKASCPKAGEQAKAGCCAAGKTTVKNSKPLPSPKANSLASK
jgi:hypothetical protein